MMYKEYVTLLFQSIKNKNLPTSVKIILGVMIAYIIIPTDFVPDLGFPVGIVDDTIIAAILIGIGGRIISLMRISMGSRGVPARARSRTAPSRSSALNSTGCPSAGSAPTA